MQRSIFDEIPCVWIADETLSRVSDISSKSTQKLRSKRRNKIVNILRSLVHEPKKPRSRVAEVAGYSAVTPILT